MLRICLCLLIVVASTTVAAREIKFSSPNGGSCPDAAASMEREPATRTTATRTSTPTPAVKSSKPVLHSDATNSGRMQSPRWHSFLPGMFR